MLDITRFLDLETHSTVLEWRYADFNRFKQLIGEYFSYCVPDELKNNFELYVDNVPPHDDLKGFSPATIRDVVIYDKSKNAEYARIRIPYPVDDIIYYKNKAYILPLELADEPIYAQYPYLVRSFLFELSPRTTRNKTCIFNALFLLNKFRTGIHIFSLDDEQGQSEAHLIVQLDNRKFGVVFEDAIYERMFRAELNRKKRILTIKTISIKDFPYTALRRLNFTTEYPVAEFIARQLEIFHTRTKKHIGLLEFRYVRLYEYILDMLEQAFKNVLSQYNAKRKIVTYKSILHQLITRKNKLNYVNIFSPFTEIRHKTRASIPYEISTSMRNLDESQMYNVCPFDTPDKDDTGSTLSLTPTAILDELGRFPVNYFVLAKEG